MQLPSCHHLRLSLTHSACAFLLNCNSLLLAGCCTEQKKPKVIFIIGTFMELEYALSFSPSLSLSLPPHSHKKSTLLERAECKKKKHKNKNKQGIMSSLSYLQQTVMQLVLPYYYSLCLSLTVKQWITALTLV